MNHLTQAEQAGQPEQDGFTLIEVMVALLIIAVALAALSQTLAVFTKHQAGLTERLYAGWVAQNRLVELQQQTDEEIETQLQVSLAGAIWVTELNLVPTPVPGMMRAELAVTLEGSSYPSAQMVTVIGQ